MVIQTQGHQRNLASRRLTSLVGLQKPLYKGIKVEEEKLWQEECTDFNIYVTEVIEFSFFLIQLYHQAQLVGNYFLLLFFLNKHSCPRMIQCAVSTKKRKAKMLSSLCKGIRKCIQNKPGRKRQPKCNILLLLKLVWLWN